MSIMIIKINIWPNSRLEMYCTFYVVEEICITTEKKSHKEYSYAMFLRWTHSQYLCQTYWENQIHLIFSVVPTSVYNW